MHSIDSKQAQKRISAYLNPSPEIEITSLNEYFGARIILKAEFLSPVKAFKIRGAFNFVLKNRSKISKAGLITHSSGNHGQALAYVGLKLGIPVTVVVPENAPKIKIAAMEKWSAKIAYSGNSIAEREMLCNGLAATFGSTIVPPYDHADIIEGQGTTALELMEKYSLDALFCPVGGGGLLAGSALVCKQENIPVFGCEPEMAADAFNGFKAGMRQVNQETTKTIADGLRTTVGTVNFPIILDSVKDIFLCKEEQILSWAKKMLHDYNLLIETSSATALACLDNNKEQFEGKTIGLIITGGNVEPSSYL